MNIREPFWAGFRGALKLYAALLVALLVTPFSIVRAFISHDFKTTWH